MSKDQTGKANWVFDLDASALGKSMKVEEIFS